MRAEFTLKDANQARHLFEAIVSEFQHELDNGRLGMSANIESEHMLSMYCDDMRLYERICVVVAEQVGKWLGPVIEEATCRACGRITTAHDMYCPNHPHNKNRAEQVAKLGPGHITR